MSTHAHRTTPRGHVPRRCLVGMALYALVLVEATLRILYGRAVSGLALDLLVVAAGLVAARRLDWWVPAPLAPAVRTFRRFRGAEVADPG